MSHMVKDLPHTLTIKKQCYCWSLLVAYSKPNFPFFFLMGLWLCSGMQSSSKGSIHYKVYMSLTYWFISPVLLLPRITPLIWMDIFHAWEDGSLPSVRYEQESKTPLQLPSGLWTVQPKGQKDVGLW